MSVMIGHSSIDERGKTTGGQAGDQTTKEVCTRAWYNKSWNIVLRCKDPAIAEKMAKICEQGCANDKIGYDQNQRNSLYREAKKVNFDLSKITTACECDCSSFMSTCAIGAGVPAGTIYVDGNLRTTRTMREGFLASGKFEVLTDPKYLTTDEYLKRGDILVREGKHTVMVLTNGSKAVNSTSSTTTKETVIGYATAKRAMNIRNGIGTDKKVLGSITKGTQVEVVSIKNGWYKIIYANGYGYTSNVGNKYYNYREKTYKVKVTVKNLNVRAGASVSYDIKKVVHKNEILTIVDQKGNWGKLSTGGWVYLSYTKKVS